MDCKKDYKILLMLNELSTVLRHLAELLAKADDPSEERYLTMVINEMAGCIYNIVHFIKRDR